MSEHPRTSRHLRLVDPDETVVAPDPFAMPVPRPRRTVPLLRVLRPTGTGVGRAAAREKPS
jgi:hypothetical protein